MNSSARKQEARPGLWGGLMIASAAAILGLKLSNAIAAPILYLLLIIPAGLGVQYFRAMQSKSAACGSISPALLRYNRGIALSSLGYATGLGIAVSLWNRYDPSPPAVFALALLPAIPTFAMIWVMGKYIVEESDEYLRHRATVAALFGLGLALALGTFWGFMEMFGLVPHVWAWWVMPVWAIGMGIGQGWMSLRDRGHRGMIAAQACGRTPPVRRRDP